MDHKDFLLLLNGGILAALAGVAEIGRRLLKQESDCQRRLKAISRRVRALEANGDQRHKDNVQRLTDIAAKMPPAPPP